MSLVLTHSTSGILSPSPHIKQRIKGKAPAPSADHVGCGNPDLLRKARAASLRATLAATGAAAQRVLISGKQLAASPLNTLWGKLIFLLIR